MDLSSDLLWPLLDVDIGSVEMTSGSPPPATGGMLIGEVVRGGVGGGSGNGSMSKNFSFVSFLLRNFD